MTRQEAAALGRAVRAAQLPPLEERFCNPGHLRVGTQSENMADRIARGHIRRGPVASLQGERHPRAKLKANNVAEIRKLLAEGVLQKAIAAQFGVAQTLISQISRRKIWAHV